MMCHCDTGQLESEVPFLSRIVDMLERRGSEREAERGQELDILEVPFLSRVMTMLVRRGSEREAAGRERGQELDILNVAAVGMHLADASRGTPLPPILDHEIAPNLDERESEAGNLLKHQAQEGIFHEIARIPRPAQPAQPSQAEATNMLQAVPAAAAAEGGRSAPDRNNTFAPTARSEELWEERKQLIEKRKLFEEQLIEERLIEARKLIEEQLIEERKLIEEQWIEEQLIEEQLIEGKAAKRRRRRCHERRRRSREEKHDIRACERSVLVSPARSRSRRARVKHASRSRGHANMGREKECMECANRMCMECARRDVEGSESFPESLPATSSSSRSSESEF
jgi:hypothetical protein